MTERRNLLEVDGARLWSTIERSALFGPGKAGGLRRLALSDSDKEMRDQFVEWCQAAGCAVSVDRVGNIFARRAGSDDSLAPVLIGSHLDTQAAGGRYDGILGVLAGLEIVRTLNGRDIATRRPIEVVSWSNEEGARFQPPMIASGAFAGVFDTGWVLEQEDDDGCTFGGELARIGYAGDAPVGGRALDSYFELHIEQGPILEAEEVPLGIVTGGYTSYGLKVDVHGETAHSGPTPMDQRKNALIGAAMLAVRVNEIGWEHHPTGGKTTVPRLVCWPNKPGILPEYAQLSIDLRHPEPAVADAMIAQVEAAIGPCAEKAKVEIEVVSRWRFGDEVFDPELIATLKAAAEAQDVPWREIQSQAGHDAYNMTKITPTALIFTPCKDGITHNEGEHIELDYTLPGVNVLLNAVLARADR
ncbi:MAG: Zn-dependent hydrolase [Pseudomonadota bacterium]